jgi:GNAT superfamily N-acetyltransferase
MIRAVTKEDEPWIKSIFENEKEILGSFGLTWFRFWSAKDPGDQWDCIPEKAFVHFRVRRDGWRTVHEIAVSQNSRRQGIAGQLIKHVGMPILLKTDADNLESNAFYAAAGFYPVGSKTSKNGKKKMRLWCAQ